MSQREQYIDRLRKASRRKNLTLYLGAGVSVDNGLPTWEKLVLAMYFSAINGDDSFRRFFPNYLFAIAEWHLSRNQEPLEITARKIRQYYPEQADFLHQLRNTLYAGFQEEYGPDDLTLRTHELRDANHTLNAVAQLCERSLGQEAGVDAVITYNYDDLLETALEGQAIQAIWDMRPVEEDKLPIYHVHGFVPHRADKGGSQADDIIFTEDQYNLATQDSYSWHNLVQIYSMTSHVGLMVGLSLADRNMRRLLDAVMRTPVRTQNFALLQRQEKITAKPEALQEIQDKAIGYLDKFERSGVKRGGVKGPSWEGQVQYLMEQVESIGGDQKAQVLEQLGIYPIWYDNHEEIPGILEEILSP